MGYICDIEDPAWNPARYSANGCNGAVEKSEIASSTPIVPSAMAMAVWEEACALLDTELPRAWIAHLAGRAETIYRHNEHFRGRVRGRGNTGRDYLWSFMRHWISGLIFRYDAALAERLPPGYEVGRC